MGSIAKAEQAARIKARKRRVTALTQQRRERDRRIEAAAAEIFLGLEARTRARQLACEAETRVAAALRRLRAEHIDVSHVAELCHLTVADVRRLSRRRRTGRSAMPGAPTDVGLGVLPVAPTEVTPSGSRPSSRRNQRQVVGGVHLPSPATSQATLFDVMPDERRR